MRAIQPFVFAAIAIFAAGCSTSGEASPAYTQGKQYDLVHTPVPAADPAHIRVEEFFCFCCPHCYAVDPMIEEWRKHTAPDVSFEFVPNTLGRPDGEAQQRAFYVAQSLGIEDKIHAPMFRAIHEQHIPMAALASARDLFESVAGVKPADFDQLSSSIVVDGQVRAAEGLAHDYGITSTPSVVVGGKYVITGGSPDLTKIMDFLIDKVRKERKTS